MWQGSEMVSLLDQKVILCYAENTNNTVRVAMECADISH